MKKALVGFLAVALVAGMSALVFADGKGLGITGSPHDFSDNTAPGAKDAWNNSRQEICRVCHVPHDHNRDLYTKVDGSTGLLWNHDLSVQSYTMYASGTLDGASSSQPDGYSKLCLGCHDGTVAISSFDGKHFTSTPDNNISSYDSGFQVPGSSASYSLQGTHPISIVYDTSDTGLNPITNTMGTSGTIASLLQDNKVQCSTCHDVHDKESVANTHLLRVSQKKSAGTASGLCLTCHNK